MALTAPTRPPEALPSWAKARLEDLQRLEDFFTWENDLFARKELEPSDKLLIRYQRLREIQGKERPEVVKGQDLWRLDTEAIGEQIGMSASTISRRSIKLAENGLMDHVSQPYTLKNGQDVDLVYTRLAPTLNEPDRLGLLDLAKPRNHGGDRYQCEHCSTPYKQIRRRTILSAICENKECSHYGVEETISEKLTIIKQNMDGSVTEVEATCNQGDAANNEDVEQAEQVEATCNQEQEPMPVADCNPKHIDIGVQIATEEADSPPLTLSPAELLEQAAALLVEIAGDEPMHGEMNMRDKAGAYLKYGYVRHPFALEDARAHLAGKKTKAARLLRSDGKTRALCFDADTDEDWQRLLDAAHLLRAAGYAVLLEDSPAGRGGHLWIIYSDLVDVRAAYRHVCELAPMLASIKEYWPYQKKNVRLPGGKYVTPDFSAQCKLYDAIGAQIAETRAEAAAALLSHQTPAAIVPEYPPDPEPAPKKRSARVFVPLSATPLGTKQESSDNPTVAQLVARFNETHRLEDIHPLETATHARATWRNEKGRPSVSYLPDGRWFDHGHADQKTGDKFDLACLVWNKSKSEMLRDLRGEWLAMYRPGAVQTPANQRTSDGGGLSAQPISPDLQARIEAFTAQPCAHCGGYEWILDEGRLRCPCYLKGTNHAA